MAKKISTATLIMQQEVARHSTSCFLWDKVRSQRLTKTNQPKNQHCKNLYPAFCKYNAYNCKKQGFLQFGVKKTCKNRKLVTVWFMGQNLKLGYKKSGRSRFIHWFLQKKCVLKSRFIVQKIICNRKQNNLQCF